MDQKTGVISIRELEKNAIDIEGQCSSQQRDAWVLRLLERAAPASELTGLSRSEWAEQCEMKAKARVEKVGGEYYLSGSFQAKVPAPCSRCGDNFSAQRKSNFHIVIHRLDTKKKAENEDSGDADFVYIDRDQIEVSELLAEQLIVLEPLAECPRFDRSGSCLLCHKNPQYSFEDASKISAKSAGQEVENKAFSPFSQLADLVAEKAPKQKASKKSAKKTK